VGGANAVFMAICGMQYVGLVSVVCGVTNLIPSFGPVIGAVIGGFILLLVNPWHALLFLGFTAVLQTLDGYVIKPKLFGDSLGVSGLLILISIVLFGNIFGVVGILLAIPLAAIIDFTYEEGILPLLEMRRAKLDAEEAADEAEGIENGDELGALEVLTEMSEGKKRK
jgi:predicted PurR-regulated permease PerM